MKRWSLDVEFGSLRNTVKVTNYAYFVLEMNATEKLGLDIQCDKIDRVAIKQLVYRHVHCIS